MKGIDISNNQGTINFQAVKDSGIEICYIKASEGLTYNDPTMQTNYNNAKSVGLKIGFYHFMRHNDPTQEAIHFLNCISGYSQDCIPMLDVEHSSLQDGSAVDRIREFADYCKSQGVKVGLYTYTSFLKESMGNTLDLPLWIAEYGVDKPHIDIDYVGFQYSEKGTVNGVTGNCDLDEFTEGILINNGSEIDMKNIVCVNNSVDERAGNYLADFLACPIVNLGTTNANIDYSKIENVYFVGGGEFPTIGNSKIIKGNDRYDTNIEVMKNIGKLQ